MLVKFNKVFIENFLSIGKAEIKLSDRGYTLIEGVNNNKVDNAKSNGSGKSSIGDAICWALTGETIRGISKNITNIHTTGGTSVEVQFYVDEVEYRVCRYKDHEKFKTNLKIFVNGEDKSGKGIKDSEKLLEEYLPDLTSQLIGSVIVLGQGLPQRFSNNTPSGRKEVLEKLSKSDFMIEDIKNRLVDRKTTVAKKIRDVEDKVLYLSSNKSTLEKQIECNKVALNALKSPDFYDEEICTKDKEIEKLETDLELYSTDLEKVRDKIQSYNEEATNLLNLKYSETNRINDCYKPELDDINSKLYSLKSELKYLENEIHKKSSITDVCPTCGQKLPDVVKPDLTEDYKNRDRLLDCINDESHLLDMLNKKKAHEIYEVDFFYKNNCETYKTEASYFKDKAIHLNNSINSINSNLNTLRKDRSDLALLKSELGSRISTLKESITSNESAIKEIEDKISYMSNVRDRLYESQAVVNKMYSIATRDFRGYLLENVVRFIRDRAKEYSLIIFDTDKIEFFLDGNNINISYDDKMYENLSGGEKQKIDLIMQFSIRDMLCSIMNFSSNIMFLDEIFDNLDSVGCDKVLNLISSKIADVESLFIVTHHSSELSIPYDNTITVIKNNDGVSEVRDDVL